MFTFQLAFSTLLQSKDPNQGTMLPIFRLGLHLRQSKQSPIDGKLTIKTNDHTGNGVQEADLAILGGEVA